MVHGFTASEGQSFEYLVLRRSRECGLAMAIKATFR